MSIELKTWPMFYVPPPLPAHTGGSKGIQAATGTAAKLKVALDVTPHPSTCAQGEAHGCMGAWACRLVRAICIYLIVGTFLSPSLSFLLCRPQSSQLTLLFRQ